MSCCLVPSATFKHVNSETLIRPKVVFIGHSALWGVFPLKDFLEDIGSLIRISLPLGFKSFPHRDSNAQSQAKLTVKPISASTMAPGEFAKFYETTLLFDGIS